MDIGNLITPTGRALASVLCVALFLSGCGNLITADVRGQVGFMKDDEGKILVAVQPCGLEIDSVEISGAYNSLTNDNATYAAFRAEESVSDFFVIDLEEPDPNWKSETPVHLPEQAERLLLGLAWVNNKDAQARQVTRTLGEIHALEKGQILTGDSNPSITLEEFKQCPHPADA